MSPSQPMYCNSEFASCDYVLPPQELSLTQTEDQLEAVFNLTRISVQTGEISQECFSRFSALYCRQVFSFCREVESLNGTSNVSTALFVPANTSLCSEDCVTVIETNCLDQGWAILTNAINKLRRDSNISLPSLKQTDECNTTLTTTGEDCTSISDGEQQLFVVSRFYKYSHDLISYAQAHLQQTDVHKHSYPQQTTPPATMVSIKPS